MAGVKITLHGCSVFIEKHGKSRSAMYNSCTRDKDSLRSALTGKSDDSLGNCSIGPSALSVEHCDRFYRLYGHRVIG